MKTFLFPGSFNPFTLGHKSIVERALPLCDRLVIAIGHNSGKDLNREEITQRVLRIKQLFQSQPMVEVIPYEGLTIDACRQVGAKWMLRGVRSVADFEYERNLADINRSISGIETIILFTLPEYSAVSSSVVRELQRYGADTTPFLP